MFLFLCQLCAVGIPLRWRHYERDGVSNHQPRVCLLSRLLRHRSKKTSQLRVTGLCAGNSPLTGEFPAQRASNAENASIWWCHHAIFIAICIVSIMLSLDRLCKSLWVFFSIMISVFDLCVLSTHFCQSRFAGIGTIMTLWHGHFSRVTDPLCGESTGQRWMPLIKWQ